jgi:hypothetical protein
LAAPACAPSPPRPAVSPLLPSVADDTAAGTRAVSPLPCPICLGDLTPGSVTATTCAHAFHTRCLTRWFALRHVNCPVCRHGPLLEAAEHQPPSSAMDWDDDERSAFRPLHSPLPDSERDLDAVLTTPPSPSAPSPVSIARRGQAVALVPAPLAVPGSPPRGRPVLRRWLGTSPAPSRSDVAHWRLPAPSLPSSGVLPPPSASSLATAQPTPVRPGQATPTGRAVKRSAAPGDEDGPRRSTRRRRSPGGWYMSTAEPPPSEVAGLSQTSLPTLSPPHPALLGPDWDLLGSPSTLGSVRRRVRTTAASAIAASGGQPR